MIEKLLTELSQLLDREKDLLVKSSVDFSLASQLEDMRVKKEDIAQKLKTFPHEEISKYEPALREVQSKIERNKELLLNSANMINKLFEAIFVNEDSVASYTKDGDLQVKSEIKSINKKV